MFAVSLDIGGEEGGGGRYDHSFCSYPPPPPHPHPHTPGTQPQLAGCPYTQPLVGVSSVPIGCDVCLEQGSSVQLNCTASLGSSHSDTLLRYLWLYANTGIPTGITTPMYTATGQGQLTCMVFNSGLNSTRSSNVYCE